MEKPVSIELPKLDDKRQTSMSVSLFDIGTNCGEPVKITLPKINDKRETAYDVSFYPATFPSVDSLSKITLPKLDGKRQTAYDIELLPMECGGLNNCTCFYGKVSGIGDLGDYHTATQKTLTTNNTFYNHVSDKPWGTPIGSAPTGNLGAAGGNDSQTQVYVRGQTSFIKVTQSVEGTQEYNYDEIYDINNYKGEVTGQDTFSVRHTKNYIGFQPTVARIKQRGNTFYGTPFWLPYGYEMTNLLSSDFQPTAGQRFAGNSAAFEVNRGSSWQNYESEIPEYYQGKSTDGHYDPTDTTFNERQLGGGLKKGFAFLYGQILVDGQPFDLADYFEQCDYFSPADIVVNGVTLDKDNSKNYINNSKISGVYNFNDGNFDLALETSPSEYNMNDSFATENRPILGTRYGWRVTTAYSWDNEAIYRWFDGANNTVYNYVQSSSNETTTNSTYDIGNVWFKKAGFTTNLFGLTRQATHNSFMFVLAFGAHFKKKFNEKAYRAGDGYSSNYPFDINPQFACDPQYESGSEDTYLGVGWGLYLVRSDDLGHGDSVNHMGPFAVTTHMSDYFEYVLDGTVVKIQTKEKEIDTENDEDLEWLQEFKDTANLPPHSPKLSWSKVENIKPHPNILQYEGDFSPLTETHHDAPSSVLYSRFADFYSTDWVGDNPFNFRVSKNKRCKKHPPTPWMQLWVYYCDDNGDPYPKGDNWVRLDWDFEEKKYVSGSEEYLFPMQVYGWRTGFADNNPNLMGRLTIEKKEGVFKLEYVKPLDEPAKLAPDGFNSTSYGPQPQYQDIETFKGLYHEPKGDNDNVVPGPNDAILYALDILGYYPFDSAEDAKLSLTEDPPVNRVSKFLVTERDPEYGASETAYPLMAINL